MSVPRPVGPADPTVPDPWETDDAWHYPVTRNGEVIDVYVAQKLRAPDSELSPRARAALALAAAWADLDDGDTWIDELDRIRHANPPSPPIDPD
jgi:hypothetical protein